MNRPVNYERAQWEWNSDMYVPQYPGAEWLAKIGKQGSDRPVVPSEYSHAMGNSNGNLWDQWKEIYRLAHALPEPHEITARSEKHSYSAWMQEEMKKHEYDRTMGQRAEFATGTGSTDNGASGNNN